MKQRKQPGQAPQLRPTAADLTALLSEAIGLARNRLVEPVLGLPGRVLDKARRLRRARVALHLPIVAAGEAAAHVLDPSRLESVFFPRVHGLSPRGHIDVMVEPLALHMLSDATVSAGSDIIVTQAGAVWDKHARPQFGKAIPLDRNLVEAVGDSVAIDRPAPSHKVAFALSLCGVHAAIWSHFLVQYLPKLAALDEIMAVANQPLVVITPAYGDQHLREIVARIVARHAHVSVLEIGEQVSVDCATLAHIPHTSYIADHAHYISLFDMVIPDFAAQAIKRLLEITPEMAPAPSRKLYLIRRGHRTIVDHARYEALFAAQGFELIDPGLLSLSQKIATFREAKYVVGPLSSGFTNLIFCPKGTKALVFTGLQRCTDAYLGMIGERFDIDLLMVAGRDLDRGIHSTFAIPQETILSAARDHGIIAPAQQTFGVA